MTLNQKNKDVLEAHIKVIEKEPKKHNFAILKDLAQEVESVEPRPEDAETAKLDDNDQRLFFGDEFSDSFPTEKKDEGEMPSDNLVDELKSKVTRAEQLIDYGNEFDEFMGSASILLPSQLLMDDSIFNDTSESNIDLLDSLIPSQAEQSHDLLNNKDSSMQLNKNPSKKANDVSKWFNLFSDLDPLNQQTEQDDASKNLYAA